MDTNSFDPADLSVLAELETTLERLRRLLDDERFDRLIDADYPEVRFLGDILGLAQLDCAAGILEDIRNSHGDEGAFDYLQLVKRGGMDLHQAARDILRSGTDNDFKRIEALRRYAATVA